MADPHIRIGIDIGGTFTDLQILDETTGALASFKTPTTPQDPSIGLVTGIRGIAEKIGFAMEDVRLLVHGTTIATNAVLQRRLANGVLVTTAGFEDVLEIGRHGRRDVYSLKPRHTPPLIASERRLGLKERMRANGSVETALTEAALAGIIERIGALEAEAVAVSLINAFVNPAHEAAVAEAIAAAYPGLPVSVSSDISPEIREYERTSTTVLNALLMPIVGGYIDKLTARLDEAGISGRLLLVQSNGGVCTAGLAKTQPARLLLSGPSGGALATLRTARALERENVIGVDMGGTSYDVCVVAGDRLTSVTQGEIDELPVRLPMVEIRTIGSGGGSIARVDDAGRLVVGPQSAGSEPGPVAYRRGGTEPTVTDANVAMARLDPEFFLGGAMALDRAGAANAIEEKVAKPLGLGADEAAEGIVTLTEANLAAAARLSLFEKGLDPRDFALLSFGGAGGLHATSVAEALGIDEVIFPVGASTFSAFGILFSDITHDLARSRVVPADGAALGFLAETLADLRAQGDALLAEDGVPAADRRAVIAVDMRYRGQAFELVVPWEVETVDEAALGALTDAFHELHAQRFSYSDPKAATEIVAVRVSAVGVTRAVAPDQTEAKVVPAEAKTRDVFTGGTWRPVAIHRREAIIGPIAGPALVEEEYTTNFIGSGWTCEPGRAGTLIARRTGA